MFQYVCLSYTQVFPLNLAFTFDSVQSALHAKDSLNGANNETSCGILKVEYAKVRLCYIQLCNFVSKHLLKTRLNLLIAKLQKQQKWEIVNRN